MAYSFKKLLRFDLGIYKVFTNFISFSIFFVMCSIGITTFVINGLVYELFKDGPVLPILCLVFFLVTLTSLIILLTKSRNIKNFQGNCSEITAKIESFKPLYGAKTVGEIGYKIIFSYDYNNSNYAKGYSIRKNKHTAACLKNYLKLGEMVKILVGNNNPEKIMIKEIFK